MSARSLRDTDGSRPWRTSDHDHDDEPSRVERRPRRDTMPDPKRPSTRPARQSSAPGGATEINHEDEIERIREMRARRLRKERGDAATALSDSPVSINDAANRERRREREMQRQARPSNVAPSTFRSTPNISRRELEDAGLVRRDRRPKRDSESGEAPAPTRVQSEFAQTGRRSDDGSAYSRSRRERLDRLTTDEDVLSAYSRARRERQAKDDDDNSAYSRTRRDRDRPRERLDIDDDSSSYSRSKPNKDHDDNDTTSAYSRSSEKSNPRGAPRRPRPTKSTATSDAVEPSKDRQPPGRRNTGGDDLAKAAAGARTIERRRVPPARAKSADQDLLAMDLKRRGKDDLNDQRNREIPTTKKPEREQQTGLLRSTDLTTRLRERREARAAEREAKLDLKEGSTASADLESEVERRLARRKSNDDTLEGMRTALSTGSIQDLELTSLESPGESYQNAFSVTVRLVSAIDLPQNVAANTPLCPVVKVGFLRMPPGGTNVSEAIMSRLGNNSVENVRSARVRSTTFKIMSKRDNGTLDFYQELRWDNLVQPEQVALFFEISARAVRTPINHDQSPGALHGQDALAPPQPTKRISTMAAAASPKPAVDIMASSEKLEPVRNLQKTASGSEDDLGGTFRSLWRKATTRKPAELEAAEAAAAVARMLVEQDKPLSGNEAHGIADNVTPGNTLHSSKLSFAPYANFDVALRRKDRTTTGSALTKDVRLGTLVVPLAQLPLQTVGPSSGMATMEKWFPLDPVDGIDLIHRKKQPSLRLEISVARPETMNDIENNLDLQPHLVPVSAAKSPNSSLQGTSLQESKEYSKVELSAEKNSSNSREPVLEPGVVDFIAVVGCKDIGTQKNDNGSKGWVESTPECVVLEQFPPDNSYHVLSGRKALMPEMVQWFCFPEGTRLWRGIGPPSHADLNLKRFSASSPPSVASSIAAFDACLNCTTSFSWFVIASNSDEYGSKLVKTYGAVIRFYAPAPAGVDPKQEDFAQTIFKGSKATPTGRANTKRLWVPMGICLTSSLPIVGVMEAMLLRLCEDLVLKIGSDSGTLTNLTDVHKALAQIILKYQRPIAGAVNCSVPFLSGDRFLLSLPPPTCLPPLPHGKAIVSACRLLGAEGLNFILSAVLTECKILIHSQEIADIAMVAEVVTALIYPFSWSLPYIPILPVGMLEFVEAPLSYMLGIPSHSLRLMDPQALDDVVVIDLDSGFSSGYLDGKRPLKVGPSKSPPPLPSQMATSISKAVYKLLRAEEELDEQFGMATVADQHSLPRLEAETLAEREFRVSVAVEVCGLLRGYQECLGPVFNRDKFLKIAPALFEDRRDHKSGGVGLGNRGRGFGTMISPRSKRFLSLLVNTQNFHQLLESLESEDVTFFHEVMETFEDSEKFSSRTGENSSRAEKALTHLVKTLQKAEDKVPTYRVDKGNGVDDILDSEDEFFFDDDGDLMTSEFPLEEELALGDPDMTVSFTSSLLQPTEYSVGSSSLAENSVESASEYAAQLEKSPWRYVQLFDLTSTDHGVLESVTQEVQPVSLRQAIGDRRYRAWEAARDQKEENDIDLAFEQQHLGVSKQGISLDLTALISSASTGDVDVLPASPSSAAFRKTSSNPEQQRLMDAKDRDIIRRCLDRAHERIDPVRRHAEDCGNPFLENGRDLLGEAENALRNPSAQQFLLSILAQRSRLENQRARATRRQSVSQQASVSRLDNVAFECLIRLSCAILDSSMEYKEYETAYRLLTVTAGFITFNESKGREDPSSKDHGSNHAVTMTSKLGLHPIFADLALWDAVWNVHIKSKLEQVSDIESDEDMGEDHDEVEYESAVATLYEMMGYGIPGEELSRFAMRVSENKGWFSDDRGRQLLLLARRITVRRDQTESAQTGGNAGIEIMARSQDGDESSLNITKTANTPQAQWSDISWCHPAAPTPQMMTGLSVHSVSGVEYMKRSPITSVASFGHSVFVTGGLDGSVFLAHEVDTPEKNGVHGIHLDWGSASRAGAGSSSDGEYGVGAVSCLAASLGGGYHGLSAGTTYDESGACFEDDLKYMDGSRVVAGTTAGDLRVWSVKDVYSSLRAAKNEEAEGGSTKALIGSSSALTRLKFSLRGRALSGHRGGVTCIDVPSQVYRPDSLISGGADGMIKLWSLRPPASGRRQATVADSDGNREQRGRGGDALSVLSGHSGRISCVKTAWHGDRLISGGADQTIRVWDLAAAGKCINILSGHGGWVTHLRYWGPNTIISGSTDRTMALWDARVSLAPLFMLRYHDAPISDILIGLRTDPVAVSAAADGSIAAWDFRVLSQTLGENKSSVVGTQDGTCKVVRNPRMPMKHGNSGDADKVAAGPVLLCRNVINPASSILSVSTDAVVREWDISSGELVDASPTGHCDAVSAFLPCRQDIGITNESDYTSSGTITASLDGTVRVRRLKNSNQ